MAEQEQNAAHPPRRGLKLLLGLSLALNLLVVGLVAGAVVRHDGFPDRGRKAPALSAFGAPYMQALPRQQRREVLRQIRSQAGDELPDRPARRAMFAEVLGALRAQPFDKAALTQMVERQAEITVTVQRAAQSAWVELVADMSDAERLDYAFAVEEALRRGPRKKE